MLDGSREEALLAVDLYNQTRQPRRLEGFLIHMHLAWLYLLHAQFHRDHRDYHFRKPNGRFERVDGEPKTWDLAKSVAERWPQIGAVRKNLELTIALRNKIEHRYHEAIVLATSGYAQALLLNYEEELTSAFGPQFSLGEALRFPIFVGSLTAIGNARIEELRAELPKTTKDFLAHFEADLDPGIASDQRYEFRINLVPKLGAKTEADTAMTFVREADLSDDERAALQELGRSGRVVVREQVRSVASAGKVKPSVAVSLIQKRIQFKFNMAHFVKAWHVTNCRPAGDSANPERTDERYCVYDEPHKDYLYTQAFIEKLVRESRDAESFERFFGYPPEAKTASGTTPAAESA